MVSVANAVNVNPDGLGQALIYPYYTARGGNDTLISVVNTSSQAKAAKVRFLEALNSREVLDFNLYLSAFDVWTAAVTADGDGAKMVTADSSCTVPYIFGGGGGGPDTFGEQEFLTFEFTGDNDDGATTDEERVASGYFEVIDMGNVYGDTPDGNGGFTDAQVEGTSNWGTEFAVTHVPVFDEDDNPVLDANGNQIQRPRDCQQLVTAWSNFSVGQNPDEFYWSNSGGAVDVEPTTSGDLFGSASIINVNEGTMFAYNATAIDNWTTRNLHEEPGSVSPSLQSGGETMSNVFQSAGGAGVTVTSWDNTTEAVNAVLMNDRILNEYNIDPALGARTEWVLTYPTKRFHVDAQGGFGGLDESGEEPVPEALAPFSKVFDGTSCEPHGFTFWDREERTTTAESEIIEPVVSPREPTDDPEVRVFETCFEANVVRFAGAGEDLPTNSEILGEPRFTTFPLPKEFVNGWMRLGFDLELLAAQLNATVPEVKDEFGLLDDAREQTDVDNTTTFFGLPVIGFGVTTFTNNTLEVDGGAVLSNYGGTFQHRGTRRLDSAE